ncbi:MAG: PH domain-containing protein [Acholeplasmataceae bacterium]|jgi:membrane protein YdbS with pleckstrin-like domain
MDRNQTVKILMKDEEVLYTYKPDFTKEILSSLLAPLLIGIFLVPFMIAIVWSEIGLIPLIIIGIVVLVVLMIFVTVLIQLLAYRNKFYTITNKRFIIQKGLLGIDFSSIPIEAVQYVSVNVSVVDKILNKGTGTITFGTVSTPVTTGQVPRFVFANIYNVYDNYKTIKELIDLHSPHEVKGNVEK